MPVITHTLVSNGPLVANAQGSRKATVPTMFVRSLNGFVASPMGRRTPLRGPASRAPVQLYASAKKADTLPQAETAVQQYYLRLQNGSDIRGVALAGVETEPVDLTPPVAYYIAKAFGLWLAKKTGQAGPNCTIDSFLAAKGAGISELIVGIGRDPRLSGPSIAAAAGIGLAAIPGTKVVDTGLGSTPAMFMGTVLPAFNFDGSIMITASHLPFNRNGLKFFTRNGGLEKGDITEVLNLAAQLHTKDLGAIVDPVRMQAPVLRAAADEVAKGSIFREDLLGAYATHLKRMIVEGVAHPTDREQPLKGLKVMVDPGNGSGGFFATKVLGPLGADVSPSQFIEPDGSFPNHQPNPENRHAMESASKAVVQAKADLGIVFDTDVDRAALVDRDGKEINRNRLIALVSAICLRKSPGATIVTDSVTSNGLAEFIKAKGGVHLRFKRGYKNVINKGIELTKNGSVCPLMIETSGHGAFAENYFLDDGAYIAVQCVIELMRQRLSDNPGASLSDLIAGLQEPVEEAELRLAIKDRANFKKDGEAALGAFVEWVQKSPPSGWTAVAQNFEGLRVDIKGVGWVLLRSSLHDPLLVLNIESDVKGAIPDIKKTIREGWAAAQAAKIDVAQLN